jgi:hypothetical protein
MHRRNKQRWMISMDAEVFAEHFARFHVTTQGAREEVRSTEAAPSLQPGNLQQVFPGARIGKAPSDLHEVRTEEHLNEEPGLRGEVE